MPPEGRAALDDHKSNKVAATSCCKAFVTERRYEVFETEGTYEVFLENAEAYEIFEFTGIYGDNGEEPTGYGEEYDFCKVNYTDGSPQPQVMLLQATAHQGGIQFSLTNRLCHLGPTTSEC